MHLLHKSLIITHILFFLINDIYDTFFHHTLKSAVTLVTLNAGRNSYSC